jgi:hypothetical protein
MTSNPRVSFNSLNSCPGLLNSDGSIPYLMLRVVLAGQCSANAVAYLANFGSTLKLEYLKTLAEAYAPGLLASAPPPRTFENSVELASMAAYRLRMPLVIQESDLILAEPGPCDVGLSTLLKLETGNGTTRKFWIAPCLVGGVGLAADRKHTSNSALRYIGNDTLYHLVPEHARPLAVVDAATLMLVLSSFSAFQHPRTIRVPTDRRIFSDLSQI